MQRKRSTAGGIDGWGWRELRAFFAAWFDALVITEVQRRCLEPRAGREVAPHLTRSEDCRGQEEEENEMNFAMGQMTPPPRAAAAGYYPVTPEAGGRLVLRAVAQQKTVQKTAEIPQVRAQIGVLVGTAMVVKVFFAAFCGIFRTPPHRVESRPSGEFFSPR